MKMKQFHLFLLFTILLFLTPTSYTTRTKFSGPSTQQQAFHRWANSPISSRGKEFESQKRRVPTGANPLHNKK
ncbi:hypothetical protein MtrunA17_Chr3g0119251 [Medicago truncatula]|uniref:Clavata3/ESR (CLE) gene family member MtCLE23 n=1 Tax=Medicago truncatula TaxID=3880 RepID=G7J6P6_MEDTR|nr:Clavata3/ESR (CLE) gene family member MtCLE23 [Medicago truncatula]RHN68926.1 hypothetical protein MtrunA17_Chr3g0119251 [Medicago truncatula]